MALAAIILDAIEKPPAGGAGKFSWLAKGKCIGVNKHSLWILGVLLLWRKWL